MPDSAFDAIVIGAVSGGLSFARIAAAAFSVVAHSGWWLTTSPLVDRYGAPRAAVHPSSSEEMFEALKSS